MPKPEPAQALAKLEAVPFTQVRIKDRFWAPRQETNRKATVEHSLQMLDKYGNLLVMQLAAAGKREGFKGLLFTDSDLYKTLEGIAYTLATHPDPKLDKRMDEIIALISTAQMEDGYIDTWFQVTRPDQRFKNLRDWHEMYCAGHLFEAAVAHHQATGKTNFLDIATKLAGLLYERYGPDGEVGYCGHPEPELALIRLWKATGDKRWFTLSQRMIEHRGDKIFAAEHKTPVERYDGTYWLDDMPIREHTEIKGHAVRAAYLMSGVADIARETGDAGLIEMLQQVWRNTTQKRIYITGGIGPSAANEGFTVDYDLPNLTAYQETCASIAISLWGHRMTLLLGDAKYMDVVETALYNGLLSGIGLDGKSFFYVNPLASEGSHHRSEWFECACCPPNVLRTIASLGGYAYAKGGSGARSLYVNLYIAGSMETSLDGQTVALDVKTDYPWDGKVEITIKNPARFALHLRNPGWCRNATIHFPGGTRSVGSNACADDADPTGSNACADDADPTGSNAFADDADPTGSNACADDADPTERVPPVEKGYVVIDRTWEAGDKVVLGLDMPIVQMIANPAVEENAGRLAIQRGPLVYCAEEPDNEIAVGEIVIPAGSPMRSRFQEDLLGGVVVVEADALRSPALDWDGTLYQPIQESRKITANCIPYGFWANRLPGAMAVWFPALPLS